jgi:hypothetical protein
MIDEKLRFDYNAASEDFHNLLVVTGNKSDLRSLTRE